MTKFSDLMFSSETDLWSTPQDLFNKLNGMFHFEIDVCATEENAKCEKFFSPEMNGLQQKWTGICWMNPPYGREISLWIEKAYQSYRENGATVVCLLPARTDTNWWQNYCMKGEIFFLRGRLKFGTSQNSAPFPSAIVIFRPQLKDLFSEDLFSLLEN